MSTVIIALTSHDGDGRLGRPTGAWLEELATPYWAFLDAGHDVVLASVAGGAPPVDAASLAPEAITADVRRFQADPDADAALHATIRLADVHVEADAIFLVGGHGTMWDFPHHLPLTDLVGRIAKTGIVGAVCHGPAGLLSARVDDAPLLTGRTVAAFSDAEEALVGAAGAVPFSLQQQVGACGATYTAGAPFQPHAVRDGNLVTGQNPASSAACAALIVAALREPALAS